MKYFDIILAIIFLSILVSFEVYWRWNNKRKIYAHIKNLGGEVKYISRIALREHVYAVEYLVDGVKQTKTVKFTFTQDEYWY